MYTTPHAIRRRGCLRADSELRAYILYRSAEIASSFRARVHARLYFRRAKLRTLREKNIEKIYGQKFELIKELY